tara:strand:+ start:944 stop:1780 length:837 start_codon:yes stop_codon:yes gene_type:complete
MGAKAKIVESAFDALGKPIGALADYLKEFDPRTYYHGSISPDIQEFGSREDFIHFGSPEAAQSRLEDMRFMEDQGSVDDKVGSIYPVKLRATNSLPLKEENTDGFYKWKGWNVDDIWDRISTELGITGVSGPTKKKKLIAKEKYNVSPEEIEKAKKVRITEGINQETGKPVKFKDVFWKQENFEFDGVPFGKADELYEGGKKQWLTDFLASKGYDSIEYLNKVEDPGSISKIVFEPEQIRSPFAKFDPSKRKSGNILASVPAAGSLGALGAIDGTSSD